MTVQQEVATSMQDQPSTHPITIEDATISDSDSIARIGATTFVASFGHSLPEEDIQAYVKANYSTEAIAAEVADTSLNKFFVARQQGKVVGFIQLRLGTTEPCLPPDAQWCEIYRIYVALGQHGGGIGKLMFERGMEWAATVKSIQDDSNGQSNGAHDQKFGVWLGVWEENYKAQRFYKRFGFEVVGDHDFVMGETTQTDHIMIKWL